MRILKLSAENVKRIKVFELTPNKYVNRISGANGSGKTSVLDAIEWALTGARNVPSAPVRRGAGKATIRLDLGEIIITRRLTEGSPKRAGYLTVEGKDGKVWKDPGDMLADLMGAISFDPLEFIRMKADKQFDILKQLAVPDIDLDALEEKVNADYDARTVTKKERDALITQRDAIHVPADLPTERYDEPALVRELQQASEYNAGIVREQNERERVLQIHKGVEERAKQKADRLMELRDEIERTEIALRQDLDLIKANEDNRAVWEELPQPKDAAELGERINQARIINAAIDRAARRAGIDEQVAAKQTEWERLDESVKQGEKQKADALANAKFPVDGLGFGNKEVIYLGLPFDQASNAEQIRASVAIGMATNPKLRVMRIKDGSLLDSESLDIVAEMTHTEDFQLFIEAVDESGKIGVYLEDGEIKTINEDKLDAPRPVPKKVRAKKIPATA